jgi:AGZA family xanthine/uracil permease-like MFS transporter
MKDFFKLKENNTNIKTEFIAGFTTFLTMAYIIFVNSDILALSGMDKESLIIITCLVSFLASTLMGLWANLPIAQAPGMGLNAFFTFTLCMQQKMPWQEALGVVFISGMLFVLLTFTGIRKHIINAIPESLKNAISVGIGLFIAFVGFQNLKLIVSDDATLVKLGNINIPILLGIFGLFLMIFLYIKKVKGAILISILSTTFLGFIILLIIQ